MTDGREKINTLINAYRSTMWECGDCGNKYQHDIHYCPNEVYDSLLVSGAFDEPDPEPEKPTQPYVNVRATMSVPTTHFCPKCGENWHGECSYGESDDPLVIAIADALFEDWFGGQTVDDLKRKNAYNGEYEIAVEDAKTTVAAGYEHLGFQR